MRTELTVDKKSLAATEESVISRMLLSSVQALRTTARATEQDLEAMTRAAVPGNAWRAWKSAVYPRANVPAYEPVAEIFANGKHRSRGMLSYWTSPGTNRAKGNRYLAVPMNDAKHWQELNRALRGGGGTGAGDVEKFARSRGLRLRVLARPGKTLLLVADGYQVGGAFVQISPASAAAKQRGGQSVQRTTIPLFALIETQPHANRVSVGAALRRASDGFTTRYCRALRANGVV